MRPGWLDAFAHRHQQGPPAGGAGPFKCWGFQGRGAVACGAAGSGDDLGTGLGDKVTRPPNDTHFWDAPWQVAKDGITAFHMAVRAGHQQIVAWV